MGLYIKENVYNRAWYYLGFRYPLGVLEWIPPWIKAGTPVYSSKMS